MQRGVVGGGCAAALASAMAAAGWDHIVERAMAERSPPLSLRAMQGIRGLRRQ